MVNVRINLETQITGASPLIKQLYSIGGIQKQQPPFSIPLSNKYDYSGQLLKTLEYWADSKDPKNCLF